MSKHLKKKNQPAPSFDDENDLTQDVAVPGAEATAPGQPRGGPLDGESSRGPEPSAIAASARLPAIVDTWQGAAILGTAATEQREAAILSPPRDAAMSDGSGGGGRSHRLPSIKKILCWRGLERFCMALRIGLLLRQVDGGGGFLEALPTLLDDHP
ncbi:unnamed protein product [Lampetra planeri]